MTTSDLLAEVRRDVQASAVLIAGRVYAKGVSFGIDGDRVTAHHLNTGRVVDASTAVGCIDALWRGDGTAITCEQREADKKAAAEFFLDRANAPQPQLRNP